MSKQLASRLWIKSLDHQLASSLLTTCSRFAIIKSEQAMRTNPDSGLYNDHGNNSAADLLQLAPFLAV